MITLDPADAELPRHRQLANALRRLAATLAPGTRLPSEKDLADSTGFNRTTVRHAIDTLRTEGVVDVQHPKGMFVRRRPERQPVDVRAGTITARMPTPAERRELHVADGVPVLDVEHAGKVKTYAADRTALHVKP